MKKLLKNLFDGLTKLIEKYILNNFINHEELKTYSSISLSKLILGTLFRTSVQMMLSDEKKDYMNTLSTLKLILI
ncbi:hypothetical protein [Clostridium sp. BJN0013]|uniref:hypothetical protein n=1 Tax=Clostridium sp. BJN0013 TaxID=3236840 RepID=UPI0034C6197C